MFTGQILGGALRTNNCMPGMFPVGGFFENDPKMNISIGFSQNKLPQSRQVSRGALRIDHFR